MKIVNPSIEIYDDINVLKQYPKNIEKIGRICYKSEEKITETSYLKFIENAIKRGHESILEHEKITVKIISNRGVSHELVRHRICSFSQESTRYCNYKNDVIFVIPHWLDRNISKDTFKKFKDVYDEKLPPKEEKWLMSCLISEQHYNEMLDFKTSPQDARDVLIHSLKTEIVVTANLREWRHIFKLRLSKFAHPEIRKIVKIIYDKFMEIIPIFFNDCLTDEIEEKKF